MENRLPVQPLSLSSEEEPGSHWLSPDRTKLDLLDSEQEKEGGSSDLIWCQALETGADRMEQVRRVRVTRSDRSLGGLFQDPTPRVSNPAGWR